jgi:hypothetical protein
MNGELSWGKGSLTVVLILLGLFINLIAVFAIMDAPNNTPYVMSASYLILPFNALYHFAYLRASQSLSNILGLIGWILNIVYVYSLSDLLISVKKRQKISGIKALLVLIIGMSGFLSIYLFK